MNAGGVDYAGVGHCVSTHRINGDAPVVGIADVQVGAVPSERHGGCESIGEVGALGEGAGGVGGIQGVADHEVGRSAVAGGNLIEHQNTVIAAVGDKQAVVRRQRETGKIHRRIAVSRIGGVVVDVGAVGHLAKYRSLYRGHGSVGGADGVGVISDRTDHVGLADDHVGSRTIGRRNRVPDEYAAIAQDGDEEVDAIGSDRDGVEQQAGGGGVGLLGEVGLDEGRHDVRSGHEVGGRG